MLPFPMLVAAVLAAAVICVTPPCAAADRVTLGPFLPQPALTVYLVHEGGPAAVRFKLNRGERAEGDRVMLRLFDPDERLAAWQYVEPGQVVDHYGPGDAEVWGVPLRVPVEPTPGDLLMDHDLHLDAAGVYQVRVTAGSMNSAVTLELPHAMRWGVSFQNGVYTGWPGQPDTLYAYVPPRAEVLQLAGGPVRVRNAAGDVILETPADERKRHAVEVGEHRVVWAFDFPQPRAWRMRAAGFPVILCPTREAAETIEASIIELENGTVVAHRFQAEIAEALPRLLRPERVGDTEELLALSRDFDDHRDAWLAQPHRNAWLMIGVMPLVREAIEGQNLDPNSHWGGSLSGWSALVDRPFPDNRWDRLRSVRGLKAGASGDHRYRDQAMALLAVDDNPANPYAGREELLTRATASALRDLMALGEDETWRGINADLSAYSGHMAFWVGSKTLPVYGVAAPHASDEIRDLWTRGVRRIVDRLYPEPLVSTRNQSAHYLTAFAYFAEGSGLDRYDDLARAYARRFIDGATAAGYMAEAGGPDATYTGMTHWFMASYYQMTGDRAMLAALERSYRFWNHTVAPEPDGGMLGGFNFSHRTSDSFAREQWWGARGIIDGELGEVAAWTHARGWIPSAIGPVEVREQLERWLDRPPDRSPFPAVPRYRYHAAPLAPKPWPAESESPFTRVFGDELIAVRRPAYYAVVYVGKPARAPFYIRHREQLREPQRDDDRSDATAGLTGPHRVVSPMLGGGLSLFWTPQFGSAVLAANWSPLTHHGVVAETADRQRYWADYFATEHDLDPKRGLLRVTGRIESLPLRYERRYRFADQSLTVELTLTAEDDLDLGRLFECIPFPAGGSKADITVDRSAAPGDPDRVGRVILRTANASVGLRFDEPQRLTIARPPDNASELAIGHIAVELPLRLERGRSIDLVYTLGPASP